MITTLSNEEFDSGPGRALTAALNGPVYISECGNRTHVLLSFEEYQRLAGNKRNLLEALSMPGLDDIEFDPPRLRFVPREVDFDE